MPVGELAALGAAVIWASTAIVFTSAGRIATPTATNTFKTVAAVFLFGAVLIARDGVPWGRGVAPFDVALLGVSGLFGLSLGDSLLFRGFVVLGTRRAMLVFSLNPVIGAVGGFLFLGERLGLTGIAGMAIALSGIALVVGEKRRAVPDGLTHPPVPDCGATPCPEQGFAARHATLTGVLFPGFDPFRSCPGVPSARRRATGAPPGSSPEDRHFRADAGVLPVSGGAGGRSRRGRSPRRSPPAWSAGPSGTMRRAGGARSGWC